VLNDLKAPSRGGRMRIIVTDLTRFHNKDIVCIAGINPKTGECIRPLPYLKVSRCIEENILPGAILSVKLMPSHSSPPHVEDRDYSEIQYLGLCDMEEFEKILSDSDSVSVQQGFGLEMEYGQKYFTTDNPPKRSIITVAVDSENIVMRLDQYNIDRIKVIFTDHKGDEFKFLSVTDLCLCEYAEKNAGSMVAIDELNDFLYNQRKIILRIGITRSYKSPDGREGYWIQLNGLYTFPDVFPFIRSYFSKN
jgi:hypothetical protein